MTRDEMISIINNELKDSPQATSLEIAKKHKIPIKLVQIFKIIISRNDTV